MKKLFLLIGIGRAQVRIRIAVIILAFIACMSVSVDNAFSLGVSFSTAHYDDPIIRNFSFPDMSIDTDLMCTIGSITMTLQTNPYYWDALYDPDDIQHFDLLSASYLFSLDSVLLNGQEIEAGVSPDRYLPVAWGSPHFYFRPFADFLSNAWFDDPMPNVDNGGIEFYFFTPGEYTVNFQFYYNFNYLYSNDYEIPIPGIGDFPINTYFPFIGSFDEQFTFTFQVGPFPNDSTQPVPEPATMLLLGSGLVGLAGFGRKRFFKK